MNISGTTPAGWYTADTDPAGTERYWDGTIWTTEQRQAGMPFSSGAEAQRDANNPYGQHFVESNLAGLGNRIAARVLDLVVWVILSAPITAFLTFAFLDEASDAQLDGARLPLFVSLVQLAGGLINACLIVGYETLSNMKWKASLGKRVTQTKVVKLDGSPLSFRDHMKRMSPYIALSVLGMPLSFLPQSLLVVLSAGIGLFVLQFVIGVAAIIMIASGDDEQAPWDKISGTTVVRDPS